MGNCTCCGKGAGNGGKKKKYKWDIKAADQYLWASSQGGAMKVVRDLRNMLVVLVV